MSADSVGEKAAASPPFDVFHSPRKGVDESITPEVPTPFKHAPTCSASSFLLVGRQEIQDNTQKIEKNVKHKIKMVRFIILCHFTTTELTQ